MVEKNSNGKVNIVSRSFATMLSDDVAAKLTRYHMLTSMVTGGCLLRYDDHGPRGHNPPIIASAGMKRSRVYTGYRQNGSFNHHSQITKFKDRYYFAWSNGIVDEEAAGQRVLISSSNDCYHWSKPVSVAGDKDDPLVAYNSIALHAEEDKLYIVTMKEECTKDAAVPGMRRIDPASQAVYVYASADGEKFERVFQFSDNLKWIFEAPRLTADGHMMCVAAMKDGAAILRWPGADICEHPEIIEVPQPFGAHFPYGEGSWYQTDDGTIVVYWRDEGFSCRLWVNYSTDNGKTFSEPVISDIPDSMSRVYVGKLDDGRYFLCNNAFPDLLNRMHLMLMLSDDGYTFNKVYILENDPTSQRYIGLLKENGYQYPCCLPDGDKLRVGYSVNKEDIECGTVELTNL